MRRNDKTLNTNIQYSIRYHGGNTKIETMLGCLKIWWLIIPFIHVRMYHSSEQAVDLLSSSLEPGALQLTVTNRMQQKQHSKIFLPTLSEPWFSCHLATLCRSGHQTPQRGHVEGGPAKQEAILDISAPGSSPLRIPKSRRVTQLTPLNPQK